MRRILLDANLLVLLLVGLHDSTMIGRHKRTREYSPSDYDLLQEVLNGFDEVLVTTSVLTECSNLVRQVSEPACTELTQLLGRFTESARERTISAAEVVAEAHFPRLGFTDAGLLQSVGVDSPLLTVDLDLYLAAYDRVPGAATNFNHLRDVA